MMKIIFFLLLSVAAWGVTASPTAVTVYMRQSDTNYTPTMNFPVVPITISGTGAWGITRGGTLSTACPSQNAYCVNLSTSATANGAAALPTGSDAGTVYLYGRGVWQIDLTPGTRTGTFVIGSSTITVTLITVARNEWAAYLYKTGYPSGCSNTNVRYADTDTCTMTSEIPTSTAFTVPAVGGTYVDAQFGNTITRLTAAKNNVSYSATTAFSATGKYVLTVAVGGAGDVNVYNRVTGALSFAAVAVSNIAQSWWDPLDDEKLWFTDAGLIKYITLGGATTTAANYTTSSGARPALTALNFGGTEDATDDGWIALLSNSNVCAVNTSGLTTGTQESKIFCYDYTALSLGAIDFPQMTQVDSESGKRYAVLIAANSKPVFSVGASALTYEYDIPNGSLYGINSTPHSDVGQDLLGRQQFCWHWEDTQVNANSFACIALNKGAYMMQPVEIGGGLHVSSTVQLSTIYDAHFGCNWRGSCVTEVYGGTGTGGLTAYKISSVTAATPCAITTDQAHGYSTGNSALISGGAGITSINARWTITVTSTTTFTLDGHTCAGTYTANSARVSTAGTATTRSHRQELTVYRIGQDARRITMHRSKNYDSPDYGDAFGYYAGPRASISRDGRYIAYASNMGNPEWPSVYIADTEVLSIAGIALAIDPTDTRAVLNYVVPTGQAAATIVISTSPTLTLPVVNASDGLSTAGRQYVATGLTAETQYYYRVSTTGFSQTGQFRTLPTLAGTGRIQISKGGGGTVNYGATSALGSSCTSPCDLAPTRGLIYSDASGGANATVVR